MGVRRESRRIYRYDKLLSRKRESGYSATPKLNPVKVR
jgi:hypothetical protein